MRVQVPDRKLETELQLGDVIEKDGSFYLVIREGITDKYIAKNFNGITGLFGHFNSLEDMNHAFVRRGLANDVTCKVYKAKDYVLQLVRK